MNSRATSCARAQVLYAAIIIVVLDLALARSGLLRFAPISAAISIIGAAGLFCVAFLLFLVELRRCYAVTQLSRFVKLGLLVASPLIAIVIYTVAVKLGRPLGETRAFETLESALRSPDQIDFDAGLSSSEKEAVLRSRSGDWKLYFANPMIVGYDYDLALEDGTFLGLRVVPQTPWDHPKKVWVFHEVGRRSAASK